MLSNRIMNRRLLAFGFSLIELLIVIGILGIIMGLGLPMATETIRNSKIRARAENVLWGLQQARTEALKRNATVRHQFVDRLDANCALSTAGPYWVVSLGTAVGTCGSAVGAVILGKSDPVTLGADGGSADGIVVTAGSSLYCFTSLGQLTATSCTSGAVTGPIVNTDINITAPNAGTCRTTTAGTGVACMRITVRSGGLVRMCDPAVDPNGTDSRRCIP
jgi:type IV fimbrial biogenesis protein FimT